MSRRARVLVALLAAAAVVAGLVVVLVHHSSTRAPSRPDAGSHRPAVPNAPHVDAFEARRTAALAQVTHDLDHIAVPAGTKSGERSVDADDSGAAAIGIETWTVPGTESQADAWVRAHPPVGLTEGRCCATRPSYRDRSGKHTVVFHFAVRNGVVRMTVYAAERWQLVRPTWSYVAKSTRSIDVTVARKSSLPRHGAPTVRRTLIGASMARLARAADALPIVRPSIEYSCPGVVRKDTLIFHGARSVEFVVGGTCGGQVAVSVLGSKESAVEFADVNFDAAVLHALALPRDYGARRARGLGRR